MDNPVPFAVRLAAGLIATGVERARTLPADLPGLSVSLVGELTKLSLKVQQEIASLAAAGDEFIESFTKRPEEQPAWARFDEDDAPGGGGTPGDDGPAGGAPADDGPIDDGPAVMPDYDDLRITQVRSRMVTLDVAGIRELLRYEEAHLARPAFLTMLHNRLATLGAEE